MSLSVSSWPAISSSECVCVLPGRETAYHVISHTHRANSLGSSQCRSYQKPRPRQRHFGQQQATGQQPNKHTTTATVTTLNGSFLHNLGYPEAKLSPESLSFPANEKLSTRDYICTANSTTCQSMQKHCVPHICCPNGF